MKKKSVATSVALLWIFGVLFACMTGCGANKSVQQLFQGDKVALSGKYVSISVDSKVKDTKETNVYIIDYKAKINGDEDIYYMGGTATITWYVTYLQANSGEYIIDSFEEQVELDQDGNGSVSGKKEVSNCVKISEVTYDIAYSGNVVKK